MALLDPVLAFFSRKPTTATLQGETKPNSEIGRRPTPEDQITYMYRTMQVDYAYRAVVLEIRHMDHADGRVKQIHRRVARDVVRGGLVMQNTDPNSAIWKEWAGFVQRLQLDNPAKLKSDARGLVMEGNLPMQWVLDQDGAVVACVRMPAETIRPNVGVNGQYKDATKAHSQYDVLTGRDLADFPLWQLTLGRLDPDNFDDLGCLGRPFLDASREVWKKLRMTETDLVIRRRHRAPLRMSHVLEGASADELKTYQDGVEANNDQIALDFYQNKKGGVTALQGDANLDQIKDVVLLLDCFFAGSPMPKGLMGYTDGMARDILEDLKREYYDEVDLIQDTLACVYTFGFRLHLLLAGQNPDAEKWKITFAERRTETLSQTTDRALKLKAVGLPQTMVYEELGYNAAAVEARRKSDAKNYDPYPGSEPQSLPNVKITPGNAPKGDSATSIGNA